MSSAALFAEGLPAVAHLHVCCCWAYAPRGQADRSNSSANPIALHGTVMLVSWIRDVQVAAPGWHVLLATSATRVCSDLVVRI
jgi:hypothetical protein